jgi:hypothetical protein
METKDLIALEKIAKISTEIFKLYIKLIELDANNEKNTDEYRKSLEKLFILVNDENKLYHYFTRDIDKAVIADKYLTERLSEELPTIPVCAITQIDETCIKLRILIHFKNIIEGEPKHFISTLDPYLIDSIEGIDNGANYLYEFLPVLEDETYLRLSDLMEISASLEKDQCKKHSLENIKYYFAYLNQYLETYYLSHNFTGIKRTFDEDLDIEMDIPEDVTQDVMDYYGRNVCLDALDELMEYKDNDLENTDCFIAFVTLINLLKTGLLFLSLDGINELQDELDKMYENQGIKENNEIKEFIKNAFDNNDNCYDFVNQDLYGKDKGGK